MSRCYLSSVCCDCGGRGCGCSGCTSCQRCEACNADEVYCPDRKRWYSLVCENDEDPQNTIVTSLGDVVYDE